MATRSDVSVDYFLSPRIVRVAAPSTELTIQDLHDTVRDIEDEPGAMQYPELISTAGKEELGGGVTVGLTSTLLDAVVAFDARKVSEASGTVTTPDASGRTLTDSGATFESNGVSPGSWVVNLTDGSICSVVTVDSEMQITTDILGDGTDNEFGSGDSYKIWPVIQCEVSGGNLVALDAADLQIDAILPTAGTQIVRTSSSSATLQELADIQFASFSNGVTIDTVNGVAGTIYPTGTPRQPSSNITDALAIAVERGFVRFYLASDLTLSTGTDVTNFSFIGESQTKTTVTIDAAAVVTNCEFYECYITGTLDGGSKLGQCHVAALDYVNGHIEECVIEGPVTLGGTDTAFFLDCWSAVPGMGTPVVDCGGDGPPLAIRGYSGGIELQNKTGSDSVSIDLESGQIVLASTVTTGTIVCRGVGKLTDLSTGATVVESDQLLDGQKLTDLWQVKGLDSDNPATYAPTSTTAGAVSQTVIEGPAGTFVVTRVP